MEHDAADELDVEVAHGRVKGAFARLAHQGEALGQQVVQGLFPGLHLAAPGRDLDREVGVGKRLHLGLEGIDLGDDRFKFLEVSVVLGTEKQLEHRHS